jgi:transposase
MEFLWSKYIADNAFFTEENINKANSKNIKFITRATETANIRI